MSLRRIAIIGLILGVLLVADGLFMVISKYNGGETQAWNLPDGWIIVISAVVILIASLLAFVFSGRSQQASSARPAIKSEVEPEKG